MGYGESTFGACLTVVGCDFCLSVVDVGPETGGTNVLLVCGSCLGIAFTWGFVGWFTEPGA